MTDTSKKSGTHSRAKLRTYRTEEGSEVKLNETDYLVTLSWGGRGGVATAQKRKREENFPSLQKGVGFQTQEAYTTANRHIQRGHPP